MTSFNLFALTGVAVFCVGLRGLIMQAQPLRKVLAVNLMGSGVFLLLVAGAEPGDPVPQAMVITGIVVAVSASALALNIMLKIAHATGRPEVERVKPQ